MRDTRFSITTGRDRRDNTNGGPNQKLYDAPMTAHSNSTKLLPGEPSNTDFKVDAVHELLRDQLAPRIQSKSANAVTVDRRNFYLFKRKRTGRRCSCYAIETSPSDACSICYGVGIVGGFDKYGTITEVLDFTSPNLVLVNVSPNFDEDTRPIYLRLDDGATNGYIEADFQLKANTGVVDTFFLYQPIFNRGIKVYAVSDAITKTEIKSGKDLEPFLAGSSVTIRIEFTRVAGDKPIISNFVFRYLTRPDIIVFGDIPRASETTALTEIGALDIYTEFSVFFDGKRIRRLDFEDLLYRLEDARRFKVKSVQENRIAGVLTSTDVTVRYVTPDIDAGYMRVLV